MVCQDLVRLYNRQSCSARCMFKMDLMKAYDSVSWEFLADILEAFNFPISIRRLIMECVSSATYTLSLNGDTFGFFPGKRGLRQGDPMSPLLFTLCMEYFTRIIDCATEKLPFHFHPLCKPMRLTHLMFADDLLLFCKGDAQSIMVLLRAYESFSRASGLKMNPQKSCAYFNGVPSGLKKEILSVSGIKEGSLPFKYLGVPITAGRLKKSDCGVLIDKIVERIRCLGAKKLSFAGRLVLVKSVLSTMYNYWASLFVLPKGVMNRVDAICRNFLWEGSTEHNKAHLLAWHKVCVPQKEGGLGLRVSSVWNVATIGKLVWWLSVKPDKLWVQWVHHVYLKGQSWQSYNPSSDTSWHWRKVCHVRDTIKEGFSDGIWSIGVGDYSVKSCYSWLRDKRPVVDWHKSVWNAVSPPKHCFIAWLISSQALMLKEKLFKLQVSSDDSCCICGLATESHAYLFQDCRFSQELYSYLAVKLGAKLDATNQLQSIMMKRWSRLRKQVTTAILLAAWYLIWNQRNEARLFFKVSRPDLIAEQIWRIIHTRIRVLSPQFISVKDKLWLSRVHLMSNAPKQNGSWAWRKLCKIKDLLIPGYVGNWWLQDDNDYSISSGYTWMGPVQEKVIWARFIWGQDSILKHCFIGWLVMQKRLLTRDRLKRMGIIENETCLLCGLAQETHAHLFFSCVYSHRCLQLLSNSLGCHLPGHDFIDWWNCRFNGSRGQKQSIASSYLALMYAIWWNRNQARIEGCIQRPECLVAGLATWQRD
ncbi:uncharacterized protein LOC141602142 [Silene latifolia]|uniref:uncharacterized protein LOC141602142 n=1 Tax=Silene latifolia TaxID=37657 RepID=UPI003D7813B0